MKHKRTRLILIHPVTGAITAAIAVIAGSIVSLYSVEIKSSFPIFLSLNRSDYEGFSFPALTFWFCFFLFFMITALRQRIKDQNIVQQQEKLINTIQSLPPHDFAMKYRDEYHKINKAVEKLDLLFYAMRDKDEDCSNDFDDISTMEETIRIILDVYVNLAQIWDNPESIIHKDTVYRANLMFYYDINQIPDSLSKKIFEMKNFFVEKNLEALKSSIDGILLLEDNKFTTSTISKEPIADNDIRPLCFPITFKKSLNKRNQNLPGAPIAFVSKNTQWILDTTEIIDLCNENENLDGITKKKINDYYSLESKGRSIISMPLQLLANDRYENIGVLNIYRNKPMMLQNEIRAEQFSAFAEPFNVLLCKAIVSYVRACGVAENRT